MPCLMKMDGAPKNHYIIMWIIDSCLPFPLFEAEWNNSVSKRTGYLQVYNQKMSFLCQIYASICPFLGHFLGPFKGTNASRRAAVVIRAGSRGPKSASPPQKMKILKIGLKYGKYLYKLKSVWAKVGLGPLRVSNAI